MFISKPNPRAILYAKIMVDVTQRYDWGLQISIGYIIHVFLLYHHKTFLKKTKNDFKITNYKLPIIMQQ